jgi:hypothetical protein
MEKPSNTSMQSYLTHRFREWASSAVRMRDTIKLHAGDAETARIRRDVARQDAAKARFYFQAMNVGEVVPCALSR